MEPIKNRALLKQVDLQRSESPEAIVNMLCEALGLQSKNHTEAEMLQNIAENSLKGTGVTSKSLSKKFGLPRSTVIYKLNYFINTGLVIRRGRQYYLRGLRLEDTIEELEAEMQAEFEKLAKLASKFDEFMASEIYGRSQKRRRQ
ncbi:MAG: hypothetical protein ACP5T3_00705 [Candidatus Micrarchaeia archaeon]